MMKALIKIMGLGVILAIWGSVILFNWESDQIDEVQKKQEIDPLVPYVKVRDIWLASDLDRFLVNCSSDRIDHLEKSLSIEDPSSLTDDRIANLKKILVWKSSNVFKYIFKDTENVDYHKLVQWTAKKHGVPKSAISKESTFILERLNFEQAFENMWDELSYEQRKELLNEIIENNKKNYNVEESNIDIASLSTMGGTAVVAALATTVHFSGFAFYATMSVVICKVAAFFGVTLPFATYAGAATTIACLSGPIGLGLIAIGTAASVALLGRADLSDTTAFIIQMHGLKVVALQRSGWKIPEPKREISTTVS